MSRRKDRERFLALKRLNPDYAGFRGYSQEATGSGDPPLQGITCSLCGRRRNVPIGVALEQGEDYICSTCREEQGNGSPQDRLSLEEEEAPKAEEEEAPKAMER